MSSRLRWWVALVVGLAAMGCGDEATQVIVLVDAEPGIAGQTDGLRIRIHGRDGPAFLFHVRL